MAENDNISFGTLAKDFGIDMAHAAGKGLISTLFNNHAQKRALEANKDLMREQAMYQYQNNLNAGQVTKQSKQRAGMNVNTAGDFSPSLTPPASNSPALGADLSSGSSLLPALMQAPIQKQQADLLKEQVENQRIHNELDRRELGNRQSQDRFYSSVKFDETTGNYVVTAPVINSKLDFEALQDVYSWNGKRYTISAEVSQAQLQVAINNGQLQDNELLQKLVSMPGAQYDKVIAEIAQSDAMKEFLEQQRKTEVERTGLVKAQTDTEKERKGLVKAQTDTEKERKDLVKAQTDTEKENKEFVISKTNMQKLEIQLERNTDLSALINDLKGQDFGTQITSVLMFLIHTLSKFIKKR